MNIHGDTSLALMQAAQQDTVNAVNATKKVSKDKDLEKFDEVAQDFEAMFMTEMLKPMFAELKPDPRFGGGKGEEIFSGMMLQEYGKLMAETGSLGIAQSVKEELIRMQGEEVSRQDIYDAKVATQARVAAQESNTSAEHSSANKNLDTILKEQINAQ